MEKRKRYLTLAIILAVSILCLATSILYPGILFSHTAYMAYARICACAIVDSFVLIVLLCVLRKFNMIISKKFVSYLSVALVGSAIIGLSLYAIYKSITGEKSVEYANLMFYILVSFIPHAFFNYAISKTIFTLKVGEACFIGIIMGLVNAYISLPPLCFGR